MRMNSLKSCTLDKFHRNITLRKRKQTQQSANYNASLNIKNKNRQNKFMQLEVRIVLSLQGMIPGRYSGCPAGQPAVL